MPVVMMEVDMFACPQAMTTSVNSKETKAEILAEWAHMPVQFTDSVREKPSKESLFAQSSVVRRIPYRGVLYVGHDR